MSLAIIAGSGLGGLASVIQIESETAFADIPGVGAAMIAGHAGRLIRGGIDGRACQLVLGRRHFYEGDAGPIEALIDHLADGGATALLVTSAVGALRRELKTGELVVIREILDWQNRGARAGGADRGPRRTQLGPGWPATGPARAHQLPGSIRVDQVTTRRFEEAATETGVAWQRGTMYCAGGPLYETPAEVEFQQRAGADVAAMSGAPEVAHANRLGLPVAAVAVVTNACTGIDCAVPSHADVLAASARAAVDLGRVVKQFVVKL